MQLQAIAAVLGCEWIGDPELEITGVAALAAAGSQDLSFVAEARNLPLLDQTLAGAVILDPLWSLPDLRPGLGLLHTPQPRLVFAKAIELFYQPFSPTLGAHPTAVIGPEVKLGRDVAIGSHVVIEGNVEIGDRTQIHAQVVIYPGVRIGADCRLLAHCVIGEGTQIGQDCIIHSGAVIGDEGFGHVPQADGSWYRMPQSGRVVLEDGVDIGSNATIDRPAVGETRIGRGSKIDNLVQIGHGVTIGSHSLLVSQVGVAGGASLGSHVILGGQVGVAGHITVGDGVMAGAQAGITQDVPAGIQVGGHPHQPIATWRRISIALRQLPELLKRVRHLEQKLEERQAASSAPITPSAPTQREH